jgi:hypothetical protein
VLGTGVGFAEHTILAPGQRSPFDLMNLDIPSLANYRLVVNAVPILDDPVVQLNVRGLTGWVDQVGWHYYVGEVQNKSVASIRWVRAVMTFYDGTGTVVNVASAPVLADVVRPDQVAPFRIIVRAGPVEATSVVVSTDAQHTADSPAPLAPFNATYQVDGEGWLHVLGEVANQGTAEVGLVQAVVTLLDAEGQVINCDSAFTQPSSLLPGASAPFDVVFREHWQGWAGYRVTPIGQSQGLGPREGGR